MSDITKCGDRGCPARADCWRYQAPSAQWQSYADFGRKENADGCKEFIALSEKDLDLLPKRVNYHRMEKR